MRLAFLAPALAFATSAVTMPNTKPEPECYDVKVRAKPIAQIPTPYPGYPDRIVISWSWFVDLEIKKVLEGELAERQVSTIAILHSAYVDKTRTWLLRRNTLGGFNVLRLAEPQSAKRCADGVGPTAPYLRPAEGETLEDVRRKSEQEWAEDYGYGAD